ncbi:MAG TPA: response regulator [Planctomycetota bacterium]|nr:response regulator [Planctomycetota bacterium]
MATVLVIDDDPVTLRFMIAALTNAKIEAVGLGDAMSGVHTVRLRRPDLILMDLDLPGVNGATAVESFRSHPVYGQIPVILVSGMADLEQIREDVGAADCLSKPVNPAELVRRVRRHLEARSASAC